jgi:UDP-N-acetylmuramoyl-tripeptide--D-alanyl-D-alanine ligase
MNIEELYRIYLEHPSVQTDTRRLQPGDLFFALTGPNFNGNAFAQKALDGGAAFAVIDDPAYAVEGKTFVVPDTLQALQELALHHRKQFSIPFLAITGSNGKTTTKELVHAVLASTFTTYTTEGNLNNHIGVPLTLLKIRKDAEIAVIEMGANHLGEIASYCKVALPTHGLITNCGKAHLEGFGGEEGVRKGKGELFDHLRKHKGMAFIMQDYPYLQEMSRDIPEIFSYGTVDAGVTGNVSASEPFLEVDFTRGFKGLVATKLVGSYNLPNVLAAVACGKYFGVPDEKIRQSIAEYTPSNSRSQLVVKGSNKIILDAYNANPSSMKLAIENFARMEDDSKIVMLGAMAELGPQSVKEHEEIVELLQQYRWKHVVLVGGDFGKIKHPFIQLDHATAAGNWLKQQKPAHSSLLVKGSRSMQMEKVLEQL